MREGRPILLSFSVFHHWFPYQWVCEISSIWHQPGISFRTSRLNLLSASLASFDSGFLYNLTRKRSIASNRDPALGAKRNRRGWGGRSHCSGVFSNGPFGGEWRAGENRKDRIATNVHVRTIAWMHAMLPSAGYGKSLADILCAACLVCPGVICRSGRKKAKRFDHIETFRPGMTR